jgi:hypothetical protein
MSEFRFEMSQKEILDLTAERTRWLVAPLLTQQLLTCSFRNRGNLPLTGRVHRREQ